MWVSSPKLQSAIELGEAWGFTYKTVAFVWNKLGSMVGHYTMSSCEYVLVFKKGGIPTPRGIKNEKQYFEQKKSRRHSEKPSEIRDKIYAMFPTQSKIELFARHIVEGWDNWGDDPLLSPIDTPIDTEDISIETKELTTEEYIRRTIIFCKVHLAKSSRADISVINKVISHNIV